MFCYLLKRLKLTPQVRKICKISFLFQSHTLLLLHLWYRDLEVVPFGFVGVTFRRFRHRGVEAVHVIASVAVITEEKLVLEEPKQQNQVTTWLIQN